MMDGPFNDRNRRTDVAGAGYRARRILGAAALACAIISPLRAADLPTPLPPPMPQMAADDWSFSLSPYFWAAGLSGDVGAFGLPTVHIDPDFGDILDNLDFAFMAIGEARRDRFSVFGDVIYTKLSKSIDTPRGILADSVGVSAETFAGLLGAGYALVQDERGTLDVIGGARVWHVSTGLSFDGQVLDGAAADDDATWVDGMVGLRGRYILGNGFYLTAWGFVGAGGAKLDWDTAAGLGYSFNDRISAVVGYRALGVNYESDGFLFDVVQQGPILGAVIRF